MFIKTFGKILEQRAVNTTKFIGKSGNGIEVFRTIAKDGSVITQSYRNGELLKTITKNPRTTYLEAGVDWFKPGAKTYQQLDTIVENNLTGDILNISKSIHNDGRKIFISSQIGKQARTMELKGSKLISDTVEKHQPNGGYLAVTKKPYLLETPSLVVANNYKMPNGKVVNGRWGYDEINLLGNKPLAYSIENGGNFYSGNTRLGSVFD